jgi:anti-anti-sigma regulatory factor
MLRITRSEGPAGEVLFRLVGTLKEASMDSLAHELEKARGHAKVILDLAELIYIDGPATRLLRRASQKATLVNAPPFIEALLTRVGGEERDA